MFVEITSKVMLIIADAVVFESYSWVITIFFLIESTVNHSVGSH